ncbi:regulator of microtubule dynamics protein 1-like [Vanessa atalanta]|uniref:regulator of microtubule dynamics protein 1-like n=1 Tax=Vanessa atalanta TaxID=42275 RepID=UPI001FCD4F8D|nr:regulator of microtubule dynamics protein 1-like [Vanessa atalanta]
MNIYTCNKIYNKVFQHRVYIFREVKKKINKLSQIKLFDKTVKATQIFSGFWFLWPTSVSKNNINAIKEVTLVPSVTEIADKMFETGKYEECYNMLIKYKIQNDVEIKWRVCRALYNMAKESKYNKKIRKELILQAYNVVAEELETNPDNFAVQKWYALILDAKSSNEGIQEKIEQLENVKKHMDLAVTLNPNDASLLHMLGEWCFQISELPWHQRKTADAVFAPLPYSTYEDALEYYLRAEAAQPRFYSINLLRLGCCYLKLKKEDQAKYYLKLAASYPAKSDDDHRANKEAAELLKKLK